MAAPSAAATRRLPKAPLLDPNHQRGLTSLLSQTFGKPVKLNLTPLALPHQDPDILAQVVVQKLRDRKAMPRRVIRDAAWKAKMPTQGAISRQAQELLTRRAAAEKNPLTLSNLNHAPSQSVGEILKDLALPQVSSIMVGAGGRLSKRITANQATSKVARRGATAKGQNHILRGAVKANTAHAQRAGKRRIGSYGVRVSLGHS